MAIFEQLCKIVTGSLLLLYLIFSPLRTFAQERFEGEPGHFTLELSAKLLERDITERPGACCFGTDASPTSTRLLAKLAVDLTPNLQIFGLLGGSDLQVDELDGFSSDFGLAYGGGIRLTLYPETLGAPVKLFLDGSYLRFRVEDTTFPLGSPVNEEITWNEYVFKFGISGRHDYFEPYGGFRFSFVRGNDSLKGIETLHFDEDIPFGLFAGTDIYLDRYRKTALFIEANIIDENSITGGVKLRF